MQTQADQQAQMFPEQLKSAQLANQAHEQDLKDQQIWSDAYRQAGGDYKKTLDIGAQNGASGKSIQAMQGHVATILQHLATRDKTELETDALRHDQARGRVDAFRNSSDDDETKAIQWPLLVQHMAADKILKPSEAQDWLQRMPMKVWDPRVAESLSHSLVGGSQLSKEAVAMQDAATRKTRADAAASTAARKTEQDQTEQGAALLGSATDAEDYANKLYSLPPNIREKFKSVAGGDEFDQEQIRRNADRIAMTPVQRAKADAAEKNGGMTAGQQAVQNRFDQRRIDRADERERADSSKKDDKNQAELNRLEGLEQGTADKPGFYGERERLRGLLKAGVQTDQHGNPVAKMDETGQKTYDANGNQVYAPLSDATRKVHEARLRSIESNLQENQFRKARINGYGVPDQETIKKTQDGQTVKASDGTVWYKEDGIMYTGGEGAPARQSRGQRSVSAPKGSTPAAPQKFTEDEVRRRATAAGRNPEDAVKAARSKGLL
jgi:hypothetical protein